MLGRAIAPAATAFQHVHDPTDDAAIVHPLDATRIRRQVRFDPALLLTAQPKRLLRTIPLFHKKNQHRIVRTNGLMSSDPSSAVSLCHSR